jgi:hypothetical protein
MKSFLRAMFLLILVSQLFLIVSTNFGFVQASNNNESSLPKPPVPEFIIEVEGRKVSLVIENEPFVPSEYPVESHIEFYYNVRLNGAVLYGASDGFPFQSDSEYTILSYNIAKDGDSKVGKLLMKLGNTLDFQVEAMTGFVHRDLSKAMAPWVFTGETSGWSDTQTVNLSESTQTNDSIPEFSSWIVLPISVLITIAVIVSRNRLEKYNKSEK